MATRRNMMMSFLKALHSSIIQATLPNVLLDDVASDQNTIQTREGMSITIKRGDLADEQVDVIVNTTSANMYLDCGGVSSSILHKAGRSIQLVCLVLAPRRESIRDIVITLGGDLAVNNIFHGHIGKWDGGNGQSEMILEHFIMLCLSTAESREASSIAFPALGTGISGFPPAIVAKKMFEEISNYSQRNPNSTIKSVTIVLFPSDEITIKAFEEYWQLMKCPVSTLRMTLPRGKKAGRPTLQALTASLQAGHALPEKEQNSINVRWQYHVGLGNYENYPDDVNCLIEKAALENRASATWSGQDGLWYEVDFVRMMERINGDPSTDGCVRRCVIEGALPPNWSNMEAGQKCRAVQVPRYQQEFNNVAMNFTPGGICQIYRIQNPDLYAQYQLRKDHVQKFRTGAQPLERILYHGTSIEKVPNINADGFNRSYCGENGAAYGDGVYFAVNALYSAQPRYAKKSCIGRQRVYQCRVLTGDVATGKKGMKEPPLKNRGSKFDSVADDPNNPNIFVVFHDASVYPEYLIIFQT